MGLIQREISKAIMPAHPHLPMLTPQSIVLEKKFLLQEFHIRIARARTRATVAQYGSQFCFGTAAAFAAHRRLCYIQIYARMDARKNETTFQTWPEQL
jgi:hypothetical protein